MVEILSPRTQSYDRTLERKRYLEHGVEVVWIVDIEIPLVEVFQAV